MIELLEGVELARLTTIGTGGPARYLGRPESVEELAEVLRFAARSNLAVETIGLGSNVLAADEGVDALVLRLAGGLAAVRVEGETLVAGGGAANAVCLHRAREAGLGGFEFASAIPGTVGGGVRMNAGAYGSDWSTIVLDALVVGAAGERRLAADELGLAYRHSALRAGEVVAEVRLRLSPRPPAEIKAEVAALLARRKAGAADDQAHLRQRLQEPARGAGRRQPDRERRPEGAPARRRRHLASGTRTSSRTRAAPRAPTRSR